MVQGEILLSSPILAWPSTIFTSKLGECMVSYTCYNFFWWYVSLALCSKNSDLFYFDSTRRRVSLGIFYLFCSTSFDGTHYRPKFHSLVVFNYCILPSLSSDSWFIPWRKLGLLATTEVLPLTEKQCLFVLNILFLICCNSVV